MQVACKIPQPKRGCGVTGHKAQPFFRFHAHHESRRFVDGQHCTIEQLLVTWQSDRNLTPRIRDTSEPSPCEVGSGQAQVIDGMCVIKPMQLITDTLLIRVSDNV